MTTRHAVTSFALALCSLTAVLARTDSVKATEVIGGTCVPDSTTVREGFYETRGFGVGFRGNNAGTIRLLCPFVDTGTPDIITLSIIDQDGMEAGARVRAHFRRAKIGTNVAITIATCDSNTSNINGPHTQICEIQPRYKTRPIDEWYWWDVVIERTNPRVNVEFLGVGVRYFGPTL